MLKVLDFFFDNPDGDNIWVLAKNEGRCCYVGLPSGVVPYEAYDGDERWFGVIEKELVAKSFDPAKLPRIEDADPLLIQLYNNITDSENNMWFVEAEYEYEGDSPWDEFGIDQKEYERRIDMEIEKYRLGDVVTKNEDADTLYTCYGDLQSSFSMAYFEHPTIMAKVAPIVGTMVYRPFRAEVKGVGSKTAAMLKHDGLYLYEPSVRKWIKNNTWLAMLLEGKVVRTL